MSLKFAYLIAGGQYLFRMDFGPLRKETTTVNLACRRMSQRALMAVSQVHAGFLCSNWLVLTRTGSCWLSRWLALALPMDKTIVWGWPDSPSRFRSESLTLYRNMSRIYPRGSFEWVYTWGFLMSLSASGKYSTRWK